MLAKLAQWHFLDVIESEEDRQTARILFIIIIAILVTCLVTVVAGLYWGETEMIYITLVGAVLLTVPLWLLVRGHLQTSGFIVAVIALGITTGTATIGQGIHDYVVMAYPTIIIIASLITRRRGFILLCLLTVASISWLVYGEAEGLFVTHPIFPPDWADFLIILSLLVVAALVVYLLIMNMRQGLMQARQELDQRVRIEKQLRHLSTHDTLTSIYNRAHFEEELARLECSQEFPVTVIVADVDGLKIINDTQGHIVGDQILKCSAALLSSAVRSSDVLARIGGDEFAILLANTDAAIAERLLQRFQENISRYNLEHPELPVQLSFGTATAEDGDLADTFKLADQRMYEHKTTQKSK
jgi:diguanylate cyclase (GGDEF)-like protein